MPSEHRGGPQDAEAGDEPDRGLRQAERGMLGGQHHVAGQRELAAAAQGQSVDRRDNGEPAFLDRREGPQAVGDEVAARRGPVELGERLDVAAGGERAVPAPGEHDRAHARLRRRRVEQAA